MNNLTALPMDITQPTDTKVISDSGFSGSKEKSDSFLALIEQHKKPDESGNNQRASGNKAYSKEDSHQQNKIHDTKSTTEVEKSADEAVVTNETTSDHEIIESNEKNSEAKEIETASSVASESDIEPQSDPEDLLSFISASDQMSTVLADNKAKSMPETKANSDESITLNKFKTQVTEVDTVNVESDDLLIARSVSKDLDGTEVKLKEGDETKLLLEGEKNKVAINKNEQKNDVDLAKYQEESSAQAIKQNSTITLLDGDVESAKSLSNEQSSKINSKYMEANGVLVKTSDKAEGTDDLLNAENDLLSIEEIASSEEVALGTKTNKLTEIPINQKTGELTNGVASSATNKTSINNVELANISNKLVEESDIDNAESIGVTDKVPQSISLDKNTTYFNTQDAKQVTQMSKESQKLETNTSQENDQQSDSQSKSQNKSSEESADLTNATVSAASNKPAINTLFDTLSQREASQSIQRAEDVSQSEQSFENVMSTISSEITQTQKNTAVQQTEVISLMRKDATYALKEKVMVMINQKIQQVDIQLDPPELGNMHVRINMQNEQAVVNFVVQNQQAKDALDQNLDKLKNMMAENGVDVGEANIDQQSNQSSNDDQEKMNGGQGSLTESDIEQQIDVNSLNVVKASSTGVDYYA